jgi:hypothetical protein
LPTNEKTPSGVFSFVGQEKCKAFWEWTRTDCRSTNSAEFVDNLVPSPPWADEGETPSLPTDFYSFIYQHIFCTTIDYRSHLAFLLKRLQYCKRKG